MKKKNETKKCDECNRKAKFICDEGHLFCGKCQGYDDGFEDGDDCPFCEPSCLHEL